MVVTGGTIDSWGECDAGAFKKKKKQRQGRLKLIAVKHEIPGQSMVIPGSLDRLLKLVKFLDCRPGWLATMLSGPHILYMSFVESYI